MGFDINLEFDSAAEAAPASFRTALQQAASMLDAAISDPITVNLVVQYNEDGIAAGAADSEPNYETGAYESYTAVRADLVAEGVPGDSNFSALPKGNSIQGQSEVAVFSAQLKAFGLLPADDTDLDGTVNFSAEVPADSLVGVALHELSHALGRVPYGEPYATEPDIFDFYRFTSPGQYLFDGNDQTAPPAYFSVNGGKTSLASYGETSDPADYLNRGAVSDDPLTEFYDPGFTLQYLTSLDLTQLDVLGFNTIVPHVIAQDGSTSLTQIQNRYYLFDAGTGPQVQYGGTGVTTGEFGGWKPIGAVAVSGGDYDLAWELPSTDQFKVWSLNSSGAFLANVSGGTVSANNYTLESLETTFDQDLNDDATIGLVSTTIHTDGSTSLTQVANRFFLENGGSGPEVQYSDAPLTVGEFGGWTPIGAVQVASGGYDLAWKLASANQYKVWSLNSSGAFTANISGGTVGPGNITLETLELTFDQDLNGDSKIGPSAVTIGAGKTLEIASPYSGKVTFQGSTGKLLLDISSSFSGTVVGMKGSDALDLAAIDPATVQTPSFSGTSSGGTLSVTDGTHSATIALLGNYLASTFVASSDGHGGTDIVDPALIAANSHTIAATHHA